MHLHACLLNALPVCCTAITCYCTGKSTCTIVIFVVLNSIVLAADRLPLSELYSCKGKDEDGIELWSCHRGTSGEEGMHGHLNKLFKGGNYGSKLAQVRCN